MDVELHPNETLIYQAKFSPAREIVWKALLIIGILTLVFVIGALLLVIAFINYLIIRLAKKTEIYIITNQRIYFRTGWLSRSSVEIPLRKINDVRVTQTWTQRQYRCGSIQIFTGNDAPIKLAEIGEVEEFRRHLTAATEAQASARDRAPVTV